MNTQKTVLILGGGYGGVITATDLAKKTDAKIILVDRQDYHLYYPNLYEVASAEEEFTSLEQLKHSVALPFARILPKNVEFVKGTVEKIHQKENYVQVDGKKLSFDYLVVALGSTSDFFGIPGAQENSVTMKSLTDALNIKNDVQTLVEQHREDVQKKLIRFVIAGGGFTGVELAGELTNLLEIISWKMNFPGEKLQIEIVEGANQLLPGMPAVVSSEVYRRLRNIGVNVVLNSMITNVAPKQFTLNSGETVNYDLLFWTGGVKSVEIPFEDEVQTDRKHRCMTMEDLTLDGHNNIYLIGDNACVMDQNKSPLPQTATQAIMHAGYVADSIARKLQGKTPRKFAARPSPFIIPVKGKWAVMRLANGFTMVGSIPWLARLFADWRYFNRLLPAFEAMKLAWFDTKIYSRND